MSRAFRYLDLHRQGKSLEDAARNLVSDESPAGKGDFTFSRGTEVMGELKLGKNNNEVSANNMGTIFHVFSGDFVQEELREKEYNLDGNIQNQITVDSTNIELEGAREAVENAISDEASAIDQLKNKFREEMQSELINKAKIKKQLNEYKNLEIDSTLNNFPEKPTDPDQSFAEILHELDNLKAIPSEPTYPQTVDAIPITDRAIEDLEESLMRKTSPSSVSGDLKKKINAHHDFYKTGIDILQENKETCPFYEQGITSSDPKVLIQAYMQYFADEEEKHKNELRNISSNFNHIEEKLTRLDTQLTRQKLDFDSLKIYLPSQKDNELDDASTLIELVKGLITKINDLIRQKTEDLSNQRSIPEDNLPDKLMALNKVVQGNNEKACSLISAIEKADHERLALHRKACVVFEREFVINNWTDIETLSSLQLDTKQKKHDLNALEQSGPSTDARSRVADTFELLLCEFFGTKYVFDKEKFILKRGGNVMLRGPHRTLSDGEKTAIAFCYFIACIHLKVNANSDYKKLFFVFDDPVTSMSYEYVFTIAQTLKNLNISDNGQVSLNSGLIDGNKYWRPKLLVLTHSSYFFNISLTNKVVERNAAFALSAETKRHIIKPLNNYVAPFQAQLQDIKDIVDGNEPDHTTANVIRSILEAIGRFCRPDKSDSLTEFIKYLSSENDISIKSALINSLSHGSYYEEIPDPQDLKDACQETIQVVEKYAPGQLEILH